LFPLAHFPASHWKQSIHLKIKLMKKFFIISTLFITTMLQAQNNATVINPRNWPGWQSTTDGFTNKLSTGQTSISKAYIFSSPVSFNRQSKTITRPYLYQHPSMQAWVARGGQIVQITAQIVEGPRDDAPWMNLFINNPNALEFSRDGVHCNYFYNEPIVVTCYQVCYTDDNGNPGVKYEIEIPNN
jgi:hypothetical protein